MVIIGKTYNLSSTHRSDSQNVIRLKYYILKYHTDKYSCFCAMKFECVKCDVMMMYSWRLERFRYYFFKFKVHYITEDDSSH